MRTGIITLGILLRGLLRLDAPGLVSAARAGDELHLRGALPPVAASMAGDKDIVFLWAAGHWFLS